MLKGLKSVDLKIIQMYFRLKWKRYTVCANRVRLQVFLSGTPTFSSGTPTFCQMGVLNSCFQNPSESSALIIELICESVKFMRSEMQNQLAGLLIDVLLLPQHKLPVVKLCPFTMSP